MIDVTHQISAVDRTVGTRVLAAGEARTVEISQIYDATVDELWDACTNPERIPRWFLPVVGRPEGGRPLPARGKRRGDDRAMRPAQRVRRHLGVRRPGELDRGAVLRRGRRPHPLRAHAHRPRRRRALGAVRPGSGGDRVGPGADRPRPAPRLGRAASTRPRWRRGTPRTRAGCSCDGAARPGATHTWPRASTPPTPPRRRPPARSSSTPHRRTATPTPPGRKG